MKVVILCGGFGTRLRERTETLPKPMVEIGGMPILWHIMMTYAHYGFNDFILCLGYKGEVIKRYFYDYRILSNDFTIDLASRKATIHPRRATQDWQVTLVDTGLNAMTGARVKRIERFVDSDAFMLTYGDGVTNLDINALLRFHKAHGKTGTVTGVSPPSRYGELSISGDRVLSFDEKPNNHANSISGGYFVFNRRCFDYLRDDDSCVLEREPLQRLAADGELKVFVHKGFWQCMDTYRDYKYLEELWQKNGASWKVWSD